jgi:tRNA pseudouridine55 synthase
MKQLENGGLLNLYKPVGLTSMSVVKKTRKILGQKAGHTGTLDPFARGVMLLCWGKATRLTSLFQALPKTYLAKLRFGIATDTYDVTGQIESFDFRPLSLRELETALSYFKGEIIQQIPPFSARKLQGEPLYKKARRGERIPELTKEVSIYQLKLIDFKEGVFAEAEILVECSSGTYIRALANDLGRATGRGAYLASLLRERVGNFSIKDSIDVSSQALTADYLMEHSLSPDKALYWISDLHLGEKEALRFIHGNPVAPVFSSPGMYKIYYNERFLGLGEVFEGALRPEIVLKDKLL